MMKIDRKKYISSNQKINDQRQLKIKYQGLQFDDRIREKRTRYKNNHEISGDNVPNYSHLMNKTYHIDSSSQRPKTERLSISDNKKNYKNTSCSQKMHNCTIQKQYKNSQSFAKTQYLYQRTPRIIENQKKQMYLRRKNTINNMLKSFYVQKMEINPKRKSLNHLSRHTPDPTTSIRSNRQKPAELVNLSGLYSKHKSRTCNRPPKLKSKFHYKKDDSMMQIFSPGPSPWKIDSSPLL